MNSIDLTNLGGFPFEQDTLKFMQDSYGDMFSSLAGLFGEKTIVSGVDVVGANVTNGWIVYGGEIIKFVGGAAGDGVVIQETTDDALFEDGELKPVYKTKIATIGSPGDFLFSELKKANVGVPVGTVLMWSGNVAAIPAGFALCDGLNGTPDLRGKFIVGYSAADVDYNALGKTGGEKTHTLTVSEMPAHSHGVPARASGATNGGQIVDGSADGQGTVVDSNQTGGGQPHENRPPFYTLAYIIKL